MFNNISFLVKVIFIITNIIFISYIGYKFYKRRYILSIFNINIYIFAFALLFTSYFQFSKEAWGFLSVSNPNEYYIYLNKIIFINCIGFIIFLISSSIAEFKNNFLGNEKEKIKVYKKLSDNVNKLNDKYIRIILILCVISWSVLIIMAGEIPLFGDRLIFNKDNLRILRPIYLLLNYMISIVGSYFSYKFIYKKNKKDLFIMLISMLILIFTGNRGPIMFLMLNVFMLFVYYNFNVMKANKLIILSVIAVLILGISMSFLRNKSFNMNGLLDNIKVEIIYGNTFSDIRDGAYVLKGYEENFDSYLYGKNYLADSISFIPSSISEYREKWSYGSFSTKTLFNMENHYGLRGGWFLEPYINFGYIGVVLISILNGLVCGLAEKSFWQNIIREKNEFFPERQIFIGFIIFVFNSLFVSSGFSNFYAYMGIIILYFIIYNLDKKFKIIDKE